MLGKPDNSQYLRVPQSGYQHNTHRASFIFYTFTFLMLVKPFITRESSRSSSSSRSNMGELNCSRKKHLAPSFLGSNGSTIIGSVPLISQRQKGQPWPSDSCRKKECYKLTLKNNTHSHTHTQLQYKPTCLKQCATLLAETDTGMHWCLVIITHGLECLWWSLSQQLKLAYLSKAVNSVLLWKQSDYMRKCFAWWIEGDKSSNHCQLQNTCSNSALNCDLHHLSAPVLIFKPHLIQTDSEPYHSLKYP